nr:unnamed protein product [Digitaria exilis]
MQDLGRLHAQSRFTEPGLPLPPPAMAPPAAPPTSRPPPRHSLRKPLAPAFSSVPPVVEPTPPRLATLDPAPLPNSSKLAGHGALPDNLERPACLNPREGGGGLTSSPAVYHHPPELDEHESGDERKTTRLGLDGEATAVAVAVACGEESGEVESPPASVVRSGWRFDVAIGFLRLGNLAVGHDGGQVTISYAGVKLAEGAVPKFYVAGGHRKRVEATTAVASAGKDQAPLPQAFCDHIWVDQQLHGEAEFDIALTFTDLNITTGKTTHNYHYCKAGLALHGKSKPSNSARDAIWYRWVTPADTEWKQTTDGQTERTNQILEDMLRACALQYGSSWEKSLCYAEFSYNNSYQQSLKKSPFEALYGRRCRTPLFWNQTGEGKVFGPEVLKQAEEQVQVIRQNLRTAQTRQKSYADVRRRDLSFEIGDFVYLKVSPMRGVKRFNVKGKLAPRYIVPFKIWERRGELAYQLELPERLAGVHDVFHVSQLKKCLRVPEEQIPLEELNVQEDLTYEEYPVRILEESERPAHSFSPFFLPRGPTLFSPARPSFPLSSAQPSKPRGPAAPAQLDPPLPVAPPLSLSLRLTARAHMSASSSPRRSRAGLESDRAAAEPASNPNGILSLARTPRSPRAPIKPPPPPPRESPTLAPPPPPSHLLGAALPPRTSPGAPPRGEELAKRVFPRSLALYHARDLAGPPPSPEPRAQPPKRVRHPLLFLLAKRGELWSSVALLALDSGKAPPHAPPHRRVSGDPAPRSDLSRRIQNRRSPVHREPVNRGSWPVHGTVDRDVSRRQPSAVAMAFLQKRPCIVDEPFEFADDPVPEE